MSGRAKYLTLLYYIWCGTFEQATERLVLALTAKHRTSHPPMSQQVRAVSVPQEEPLFGLLTRLASAFLFFNSALQK